MGDICSTNDLERFLRSVEGKAALEEIRAMLKGRTIVDVQFTNEVHFIGTTLRFDNGDEFFVNQPCLDVEVIRDEFAEVIEREYYIDYPERRKEKTT